MPVNGATFDPRLDALYRDGRELLGDAEWFDAHTHIGQNDPDGRKATAGGDPRRAGPGGPPAGARVRHARARRLRPGQRRGPGGDRGVRRPARAARARQPAPRGRRRRGAAVPRRGRPRVQAPPALGRVRAAAPGGRARSSRSPTSAAMPVLFHAGRGIPHLGEAVVDLARRYPGARLILAHAGISDLGWIARDAAELPNLFFDTAWWLVSDHLQLFADDPARADPVRERHALRPGRCRRRSSSCASRGRSGSRPTRCAAIAGGQLERIMAGEDPIDLGPAPGRAASGRGSSPPSASSPTARPRCSCRSAASTRPSRSRSRASRAGRVADDDTGLPADLRRPAARDRAREPARRAGGAARADARAAARADRRGHADGRAAGRRSVILVTRGAADRRYGGPSRPYARRAAPA